MLRTCCGGILRGRQRPNRSSRASRKQACSSKSWRYDSDIQMPPDGKLNSTEIKLATDWFRRSAPLPEDRSSVLEKQGLARQTVDVLLPGKNFWSFQPPHHTPAPNLQSGRSTAQRNRCLLKRSIGKAWPRTDRAGRSSNSRSSGNLRPAWASSLGRRGRPIRERSSARCLFPADRPFACFASLWRAVGTLLAGFDALCRRKQNLAGSARPSLALSGLGRAALTTTWLTTNSCCRQLGADQMAGPVPATSRRWASGAEP